MKCFAAITCLLALSAGARGNGYGAAVYAPGYASVDYYAYPSYAFEYAVRDPHTGDNKAHWEKRDGDVVIGAYSLVEPDGSIRVVEYSADDTRGFNAVVKRIGPNLHPVSTPIYRAALPVVGYKAEVPITIGPVAGIARLAGAPLLTGGLSGPTHSPVPLYRQPAPAIIKEVLPIKEPLLPLPIIKEPILPYPILKEPIHPLPKLNQPILPTPIFKAPIYPEPYLGPIVRRPYLPAPIYPSYPLIKPHLIPERPVYNSGYDLALLGKGLLGNEGIYDYKGLTGAGLGHGH